MSKYFSPAIILCFVLFSCSSSRKSSSVADNQITDSIADAGKTKDALSFATAVIIKEKNERAGIDAEYAWIKEHYTNYSIEGQRLTTFQKKPYDIITISLSDGKKVPLYFNISNFFGKF